MNINIEKVPFSYPGSYIAVQKEDPVFGDGIWLRSLIRPEWGTGRKKVSDKLLRFIPTDGNGVFIKYKTICTPECLRFESNFGYVEIYFSAQDVLTVKSKDMGIVLEHDHDEARLVNIRASEQSFYGYVPVTYYNVEVTMHKGEIHYNPTLRRLFITGKSGVQFSIAAWHKQVQQRPERLQVFSKEETKEAFAKFKANYKPTCDTHELATYILWSGEFRACGNITRNVTAVSKDIMDNVWSWDHCFNAYALRNSNPTLSRNNIKLFFDLQKEDGRLLDAVNPILQVDWFKKPPVHGYFIGRLMQSGTLDDADIRELYPKVDKLARRWEQNTGTKGLFYYEHAFDSGWDNATCFDRGMPVYCPDLNAYMVYMYLCLAQMAERCDMGQKIVQDYRSKADRLLDNMVRYKFDGKQFTCLDKDEQPYTTTSLIKMVPIMLGKLLPDEVFKNLADEISREQHFLVEASLASESVTSPYYDNRKGDASKPNAYWRGPVWAPPVYFIHEGLRDAEYLKLATKIATRFIALIENGKDGIYENYDAILQTGYDDSSLMWTVSVYLLLKEQYSK